ncbi:fidgetin-like protein 2 [Denticeps clupeoides]|uniref:AAA+ ATPase domain-containing protein n=1 Tax=Denticeps clupeoides TaxID=299321 RepID=A0AAY4CKM0_9TELE|nr:putative fidgetin-like protein 2 [Denticeps clupeoides]XP_028849805.1 putative fidgetin-like protein 2 [Denticeps clupeoides]
MLSPIVPYSLLKMHWNPEHAQPLSQWPEQHLDVSSTTSSPAHKSELYPSRNHGRSSYSYAWANDDISALTASNLLKRYAEKYSGVLDSPYDRPTVGTYVEPPAASAFGSINGQKSDLEPWPLTHGSEGSYPLVPPSSHEGLTAPKVVTASTTGPPGGSAVNSSLSDSAYSGSSSCSGPHSSDYPPTYNGTYLSSSYCPQPSAALPPPTSLHALQPTPTLVPSYTPSTTVYNYPPTTYPHQTGLAPSYTHPTTPYLPSGLAAPTPLPSRPTVVGGSYGYQNPGLGGPEPAGSSLKRKAFEMSLNEEDGGDTASRYRKYSYESMKSGTDPPYGIGDKTECHSNGFGTSADQQQAFKPSKQSSQGGLGPAGDEVAKYSGLKPLVSPPYGAAGGDYSPPAAMTGENGNGDQGFSHHRSGSMKRPVPCPQSGDLLKSVDPRLLELVTGELQDCGPVLLWGELTGHMHLKATLEEEVLWPVLRPNPAVRLPRTMLLFGPQGGGKTTLARSLASQLGATLYRLSGAALVSKWKTEAEQILATLVAVAAARAPSLVFISEAEALEEVDGGLRQHLFSALENVQNGLQQLLLVVCATRRPDLLKESVLRCFSKRYHVGLPDTSIRREVLLQALAAQGCSLSERELGAILQRSEGFTVWELLQLCQKAMASAASSSGGSAGTLHSLAPPISTLTFKDFENAFCKVRPHSTPKELDTCMEWSKMYSH